MEKNDTARSRAVRLFQLVLAATPGKQDRIKADPMPALRLLVVIARATKGQELNRQLAALFGDRPLQLRVIAPAYARSRLRYLTSDSDEGIKRARRRLMDCMREMNRHRNMTAQGDVGEAHPLTAIDDALVSFTADEIVIVPSPARNQWAEKNLPERARQRFDVPVREVDLNKPIGAARAETATYSPTVMRGLVSDLGIRAK